MKDIPQIRILEQAIKNSLGICDGSCVGVKGCVQSCRKNVLKALEYYNIDPTLLLIVDGRPQLTQRQRQLLEHYLGLSQPQDTINLEDSLEPPSSAFGGKIIECPDNDL